MNGDFDYSEYADMRDVLGRLSFRYTLNLHMRPISEYPYLPSDGVIGKISGVDWVGAQ